MTQDRINQRQRMFASLAALQGAKLDELTPFLSDEDRDACKAAFDHLKFSAGDDLPRKAELQVRNLKASEQFSGLAEIHPAWLLEELKEEPPRVIGVILRHLPSRHVRYIVEHLPAEKRALLPEMIEVFSIPHSMLDVIRLRFERRFLPMRLSRTRSRYGFEEVYYLKSDELALLFRDLGTHEMALALSDMSPKTQRILLNRLPLRDAKRLQARIKEVESASDALKHQARFTVIGVAEEQVGATRFLTDIGITAFSRSLRAVEDRTLFRAIQQKLNPELGYVLKRAIAEWGDQSEDEMLEERRCLIVDRICCLSEEQIIDASWGKVFEASHASHEHAAVGG